jgi:hypothetical protein
VSSTLQVLTNCWTDFGLETSWYGKRNGHCPQLPVLSDPYLWRSLAPNMVVLLSIVIHKALNRVATYRKLNALKQRNVVTYVLEILVTTAALILTLVYGSDLLFVGKTGGLNDATNGRIGLLLIATLYVFELLYRNETGLPLILHHLITILLIVLLVFSNKDDSPSAESRAFTRFGMLISLHASTEQLTFVGLTLYRLGHRWATSDHEGRAFLLEFRRLLNQPAYAASMSIYSPMSSFVSFCKSC